MFFSLALILLLGLLAGWLCEKFRLPPLLGMLFAGIAIGPHALNVIDGSLLGISADLRKIALLIILARAGLSLHIADLKKVGRPAVLMCFVPASLEIWGMTLLAPKMLGVSAMEAAVMGAVVGAVSPAVIVPKMLKLIEEGRGRENSVPQFLLAGASVDDVFVIVMFCAFTGLAQTEDFSPAGFVRIPVSILLGIGAGLLLGFLAGKLFIKAHIRDTVKILLLLSLAFLLVALEDRCGDWVPFSSLLAVMGMGIAIQRVKPEVAERLSERYSKLWVAAEILLFVLVGATVDLRYVLKAGFAAVLLLLAVLLFRMLGVFLCLIKTRLSMKERLFCLIAYLPKATVQAAIGGIPLAMGLPCGDMVLTVAVLSIVITAPLGAFLIDHTYRRLLSL